MIGSVGFFTRLSDSLKRTKDQLFSRFEEVVQQADAPEARGRTQIAIDTLDALEEVLISADVGVGATSAIV
jgi:signal recognition particle GTPase